MKSSPLCSSYSLAQYKIMQVITEWLCQSPHPVSITALAQHCQLSQEDCIQLCYQWTGLSPQKFSQYLHKNSLIKRLSDPHGSNDRDNSNVLLQTDLGTLSESHALPIHWHIKKKAERVALEYCTLETWLGVAVLARSQYGLCYLGFIDEAQTASAIIQQRWPSAELTLSHSPQWAHDIVQQLNNGSPINDSLDCRGSLFQHKVWKTLLTIPAQQITSYQDIANVIGQPSASRAVANAIGQNPLAVIIPCHRIIRRSGELGGYRWGLARKQLLLAREYSTKTIL